MEGQKVRDDEMEAFSDYGNDQDENDA